jgi:hypothetical protein
MLLLKLNILQDTAKNAVTRCVSSSYPPPPQLLDYQTVSNISLINIKKTLYKLSEEVVLYILFLTVFLRLERDFFL